MNVYKPEEITAAKLISSTLFETAPALYPTGAPFATGAYTAVAGLLGRIDIYVALQADAGGHDPVTSPTYWAYSSYTYQLYDPLVTYPNKHRVVDAATHRVKESLRADNTNRPVDNMPPWKYVGKFAYPLNTLFHNIATPYALGAVVIGWIDSGVDFFDHNVYGVFASKQASNTNHTTDQTPGSVTVPPTAWNGNAWWQLLDYRYPDFKLFAVWDKGEKVIDTDGSIYECQFDDTSRQPLTNAVLWWQDVGPSNYWAAFDTESSSQSTGSGVMEFTVAPGVVDAVVLINAEADLVEITVREGLGGAIIREASSGVLGNLITDWLEYFQSDLFIDRRQIMFQGLPLSANAHITVKLTGATLALGDLIFSRGRNLGLTGYGLQVGIKDFSVIKENEDFGTTTFVKRRNRKRMDCREWIPKDQFNRTFTVLSDLPATPCVWQAGDVDELNEALMLKAWYKDFTTEINGPYELFCNLQLQGMT